MAFSNNDKFLIQKYIKSFIINLENILITFPKNDILKRERVYNDSLELLEIVIRANYEKDIANKRNLQILALARVNKIDFYLERALHYHYISEKQCLKKSRELLKINKMIYSWSINEG